MRFDILALGEPLVEFNQIQGGETYRFGHGGDTSNCAIAAARAGAKAAYWTQLGKDSFGDSLAALWRDNGVDASEVTVLDDAPTGIYFVTHGPEGHEFSYRRKGSAASLMRPQDLPKDLIASARVLHASGISLAISESAADTVFAAMEIAKAAGNLVSFDSNLRLRLWPIERARALTHAAMAQCDIALPGLDDAELLTGLQDPDAIVDFYLALGAKVVALTLGKAGSLVATPERRERIAPLSVQALDATGAGDTYDGNFLAEYIATGCPFAAGRYANVAAALSTRGYGAVPPMPQRAEVEARLREGVK